MNIIIVNIAGTLNSGDHTQTVAFLKVVRKAFPEAEITCVHRNPEIHKEIFPDYNWIETIGTCHYTSRFKRRIVNISRLLPSVLRIPLLLPSKQKKTYRALRSADVIIAHPGGYMQRNGPALYTALLHMTLSKKAGLIIGPQTIGPFKSKIAEILVTKVLHRADCLCVREPCTFEYLTEQLGFNKKDIHLFPDLAFFERSIDNETAQKVLRQLGISEGEKIAATTFWPSSHLGVPEEHYFEVLGKAAKYLQKQYGIRTIALRQDMTAMGSQGDDYLLRKAAPFFGDSAIMAYDFYPPEVNRGIVSHCQITYGTRMHGNIYSLTQSVPAIAISYNNKTKGIMRMCGMEKYVIDLTTLNEESLINCLNDALANRELICQDLNKLLLEFQEKRSMLIQVFQNCYSKNDR